MAVRIVKISSSTQIESSEVDCVNDRRTGEKTSKSMHMIMYSMKERFRERNVASKHTRINEINDESQVGT